MNRYIGPRPRTAFRGETMPCVILGRSERRRALQYGVAGRFCITHPSGTGGLGGLTYTRSGHETLVGSSSSSSLITFGFPLARPAIRAGFPDTSPLRMARCSCRVGSLAWNIGMLTDGLGERSQAALEPSWPYKKPWISGCGYRAYVLSLHRPLICSVSCYHVTRKNEPRSIESP